MLFKISFSLLLCTVVLCTATSDNNNDYNGYKIYDVTATNKFQKEILLRLAESTEYDFFTLPKLPELPARVLVSPQVQSQFETILNRFGMDSKIINENLGESLAEERKQNAIGRLAKSSSATTHISFTSFLRFNEINAYLNDLAKSYPSRVIVEQVGKSYEGRSMQTITITNGDGRKNKKVIFVDAGIHAREWIAHAGALYVIHQLVENYAENANLLKDYDWVVLPVVNPDGYEYSHTKERMWRKTRKPVTTACAGTDGNRNFDFHWGEVGASSVACVDTFKGQTAFSEPETQVVRNIMLSLSGRAKMYLTLHAYGNYLLYPWGYTSALPSTWKQIDEIAQAGAQAIKASTGTKYTVGSSTNVLYAAAGGSDDYALAKANIPVSITMELPAGGTGFNPLPSQILPFVKETWTGIKAMAQKVEQNY